MKILIMGKFTIEKNHWYILKQIMGLKPDDKSKIEIVNKPENYIIDTESAKDYNLVITTQPNPIVLRNVKRVLGDIPLVKPYRNKNKEMTHFMKINDIVVEYKYDLFKVDGKDKNKKKK